MTLLLVADFEGNYCRVSLQVVS